MRARDVRLNGLIRSVELDGRRSAVIDRFHLARIVPKAVAISRLNALAREHCTNRGRQNVRE